MSEHHDARHERGPHEEETLEALEREERDEHFASLDRLPWPLRRRRRDLTPEERRGVLEQLFFEGPEFVPFLWRFFILTALSITIATFGLINDSAAVVIGAMLVAPLMTPIMGFSAAMVMAWPRRQIQSAIIIGAAALFGIGLSAAWELLVRGDQATISDQIVARTTPNILDLGIAIAAGTAGAYVTVRTRSGGALPGVAVAVALVPPLSTAGILFARGEGGLARGAVLLFVTNLAAIILAAAVVFMATGFIPRARMIRKTRRIRFGLALTALVVIGVAVPLGRHTLVTARDAQRRDQLTKGIEDWIGDRQLTIGDLEIDEGGDDGWQLAVQLVGPDRPASPQPLADAIADTVGRPGTVQVDWIEERRDKARGTVTSSS